ncbi:uncharacterized protein EDB91DRAFT_1128768 [Suillus paluster]|uniref:uncharacterized protein n=1 Tax=Suillus paluster TaxID=48578 RepID=UPI001B86904B|nr:uncharacterized protein EDB91DRAFT_1128768 [Suillus paluster]KAG1742344.1 hypothetical protein EDB91DRAFT_1128768 [Suillus paluster]
MLTLTFQISNVLFFLASLVLNIVHTHSLESRVLLILDDYLFYPSRLSTTLVLLPTLHSVFGRFCLYALY